MYIPSHNGRIVPLNILEIEILHHIPLSFNAVEDKIIADGILAILKTSPIIEGGADFPSPWNTPAAAVSVHKNS